MKLRRSPRLPRDLRRVQAALAKVHRRPARQPDLTRARAEIRRLVESMVDHRSDEEIAVQIDAYVDDLLAGWLGAARVRHREMLSELDRLQVPVEQALARIGTLDDDAERQQRDMDGAVENSIDRIIDEDAPYPHPLPRRQLTED